MSNRQFVLKLHGDINDIGTMQFNPEAAWDEGGVLADTSTSYGGDLKEVYSTALQNGHMVYVGMGFRDRTIFELHKYWRDHNQRTSNLRIALIPERELHRIKDEINRRNQKGLFNKDMFDDIKFLTYGHEMTPAQAVFELLSKIVDARSNYTRANWHPCPEATDIHRQMFLSLPEEPLMQRWRTEPWTCKPLALKKQ